MDAEAAALGRHFSERTEALEKALIQRFSVILAIVALLAACSTKGSQETPKSSPPPTPAP